MSKKESAETYRSVRALWFTGIPGSGKTTLGKTLCRELEKIGLNPVLLDGDEVRKSLTAHLGFSEADREENIRIVSWVARYLITQGAVPVCCFVSPTEKIRNIARQIIGEENLYMVYCNAPVGICEQRDKKNLYRRARAGRIKDFTGVSAPFEPPVRPDLALDTAGKDITQCLQEIMDNILPYLNK